MVRVTDDSQQGRQGFGKVEGWRLADDEDAERKTKHLRAHPVMCVGGAGGKHETLLEGEGIQGLRGDGDGSL